MADRTVEELLAAHKAMVATMSPEELAAHRAKIIADQLAHARANPYTGGERQAQAEIPKGFAEHPKYLGQSMDMGINDHG